MLYTHTHTRAHTHRQTRGVRDCPWVHVIFPPPISMPWSLTLSSLKVRIPFGPSYCPPSPLPPPSPFSRGTHSHGLLSTISSTTPYSGRQLFQGGWGEKKKMCVHCRLSRIHIFPSKGSWGHGMARRHVHGMMAWHASFQFNFF